MKDRIENKINALTELILSKEVTALDESDYRVLVNELYRIKTEESTKQNNEKLQQLLCEMWVK